MHRRALAAALWLTAVPVHADPTLAEQRALWEGGAWHQDFAHGGDFISGYKTDDEYTDLAFVPPNAVPLNAGAHARDLKIRAELKKGHSTFAPYTECHPPGMPYIFTMDGYGGWTVLVGARELVLLYPNNDYREIHTDRRVHLPGPLTYNGDSIGWWEGKDLVVDTVGIRGTNIQIEPYIAEAEGTHIVERYTPISPGVIKMRMTMDNPEFTRPWVVDWVWTRDQYGHPTQGLCTDQNRYRMRPGVGLMLGRPDGKPLDKAED